jgi:hypothetical protein
MKDRLEESMLSIRLSGLLEILGRDKITMMVDRLSPIDRSLKPPQPVRQNSRKTPTLARRAEPLGTMALP